MNKEEEKLLSIEEELFNKIEQITFELKHTIKLLGSERKTTSDGKIKLDKECKDLSGRFTQAINDYLG